MISATRTTDGSRVTRFACACAVALCCLLAASSAFPASAQASVLKSDVVMGESVQERGLTYTDCPDVDAQHIYVMDSNGTVYFERDAQTADQIASMTKIMTAIVAIDSVPSDTKITVSSTAAAIGESTAGLQAGDTMPLSTALQAMMIPSGNDAAEAIAESVGALMLQSDGKDSSDTDACASRFVQAMNDKATELGLENTLFTNPHGLDYDNYAAGQHSCAKDMAAIAKYAMTKQGIRDVVDVDSATIKVTRSNASVSIDLTSTDELLGVYDGVCGIKTGYTEDAGACYTGACDRNGLEVYVVIMNAADESVRFTEAETLWDWVFDHQITYTLAHSSVNVTNSAGQSVPLAAKVSDGAWIDKTVNASLADPSASVSVFDLSGNISQSVEYKQIDGDVHAGDVVGTITFKQHNQVIATQNLVATEDVPAPTLFEGFSVWWTKFTSNLTGASTAAQSVLVNETPLINDKTAA